MNDIVTTPNDAVIEYSPLEAGLIELRTRLQGATYDLATKDGMKQARLDRRECITLRSRVEAIRVREKAPLLAREKLLDAEAKRITQEIAEVEKPIGALIEAREAAEEAERVAKAEAEKKRIADIQQKITDIRMMPLGLEGKTAAVLRATMAEVADFKVTKELFGEFSVEADAALTAMRARLESMLDARVQLEAEQADLQAEKELRAAEQAKIKADNEALAKRERALAARTKAAKLPEAPPSQPVSLEQFAERGMAAQKAVDALTGDYTCGCDVPPFCTIHGNPRRNNGE